MFSGFVKRINEKRRAREQSLLLRFKKASLENLQFLGAGMSREVFGLDDVPGVAFKKSKTNSSDYNGRLDNIREYKAWKYFDQNYPLIKQYLAPVLEISACGNVLAMVQTSPVDFRAHGLAGLYELELLVNTQTVAGWVKDCHAGNIGRIENRLVMHDYAYRAHTIVCEAIDQQRIESVPIKFHV